MQFSRGLIRAGCLATAAICIGLVASRARAAEVQPRRHYDLPAQPLAESLRAIGRASGREIFFAAEAVRGRQAPPVRGELSAGEAADAALAGTGLVADRRGNAILVRPPSGDAASPFGADEAAILVTGSRIRGVRSASPVTVTDRETLENAGITDLAGYGRYLLQNFTGGQNPGVAGGGQQGGHNNINNSTTLNMRGLGPDATLTLLNGHRLAYDAVIQGVDISAIPLLAVDRIEVITDGASALYGSDAVGGVANIILRRDHEGAAVTARAGWASRGGGSQQQLTGLAGHRWAGGGFMIAFDASRTEPVLAGDRPFTRTINFSQSLITRNAQASVVIGAHQHLSPSLELLLDGFALTRRSEKANAFSVAADVLTSGLLNQPEVDNWSINPGLRLELPGGWEAGLVASRASSRTAIFGRRYANKVMTPATVTYVNRLAGAELNADGPLFALPGGDARLAIGGGWRSLRLDAINRAPVGGALTVNRHTTGRLEALFGYGEMSLPILAPANQVALLHRLSLSAALRYERYRDVDAVGTPKLGLVYEPVQGVRLSASWGRSFKAPTLFQTSQLLIGNLYSSSLFAQPSPPFPAGSTVLILDGGNPDLRSERASTWTASLQLNPLPGLELEMSGFAVNYTGRIGIPVQSTLGAFASPLYRDLIQVGPTPAQVQALVATLPQGIVNQSGRPFDPANVAAILDERLTNTAHERARGVDLAARYSAGLGAGRLSLEAAASYLKSQRQLREGQPVIQRAGLIFNPPHWRARASAGWQSERLGITALLSHVGPTRDDRFARAKVAGFTTLDISARFVPAGDWEIRFSALNLLDKAPTAIRNTDPTAVPYDSTNQSPLGRFLNVSVTRRW